MSNSKADRNLLIGVLAMQMDFVSREQLVQAMNAWVLDKSKSLDEILRQQSAFDEDTRKLLVALVDKHVNLHAGDAAKSLASISPAATIPMDLGQFKDTEIAATLALLPAQTIRMDPTSTISYPSAGQLTSKGQRFRILRPHNAGGLGVVSVACDEEFGREVALKEIKESHADNQENRRRFLVEAEITGGLEHPGIVPVYGLGQYPDGRPYYAMRFIRGDSLQDAIERFHDDEQLQADSRRRGIELRKLLGRLVDVCNAIEYAHSRGVLHRDLKPDNVMLGKYGETLVVDWGLAKAGDVSGVTNREEPPLRLFSDGTASGTQMGACFGTPGFMSPEQAEGRLDLLKATSDVYSLGATLYYLLTCKIPIMGDRLQEVLHKTRIGDFPSPRTHDGNIARALEAICLKAMALKPEDRYQSATAFSADIENWLGDEPVTACPDPWATRIARWSRHHRSLVSSVAATTMASILFLSVFIMLLLAANGRERIARGLAEKNLKVAKEAVATMLTEVGREELAQIPQMEQSRSKLLKRAQEFYEGFSNQDPTDVAMRLETAIAWRSLADIDRQTDNIEAAQERYLTAIKKLQSLSAEYPADEKFRLTLAGSFNDLGWLLIRRNPQLAEDYFGQAVDILQPLAIENSSQELARSLYNRGLVRAELARSAEAKSDYEQAIRILEKLANDSVPQENALDVRQELARTFNNLANLLLASQDTAAARTYSEKAIDVLQKLTLENPKDRDLIKELAIYESNLADLHRQQADFAAAEATSNLSVKRLTDLAQPLPILSNELANALQIRGTIHSQMKMMQKAESDYSQAQDILRRLTSEFPKVALYHDRFGNALFQLGSARYVSQKYEEALDLISKAVDSHRLAVKINPDDPGFAQHLKNDYMGASLSQIKLGRHAEAFQLCEQMASEFPAQKETLFEASRLAARCLPLLKSDSKVQSSQREELESKYLSATVRFLNRAEQAGFRNLQEIENSLNESGAFYSIQSNRELLQIIDRIRASSAQ